MAAENEYKRKAIRDRIEKIAEAIDIAKEYLETGRHAHWHGFRPLFTPKARDGKELPPHKDWVKNVFIPCQERALDRAERRLERVSQRNIAVACRITSGRG